MLERPQAECGAKFVPSGVLITWRAEGRLVSCVVVVAIVVTPEGRAEARARAFGLDWMNSLRSPLSEAAECSSLVQKHVSSGARSKGAKSRLCRCCGDRECYALLLYNLLWLHSRERASRVTFEKFLKFPLKCA